MSGRGEVSVGQWNGDESYWPDIAAEVDQPAEVLAELLGLSPEQAGRVLAWVKAETAASAERRSSAHLRSICSALLPARGAAVEAVVGGLLAASGMMAGTGFSSMEGIAEAMTQTVQCPHCGKRSRREVSRALLSHHAGQWAKRLGLENYRHLRDATTRENCRKAREKVASKRKK